MIQFLFFQLIMWRLGFFSKSINSYIVIFYILGIALILLNLFLTFDLSNIYFSGSDTLTFYKDALRFYNAPDLVAEFDIRYVGYNIYQNIFAYPFIENEMIASLSIKLNSWAISITCYFLCLTSLRKEWGIDIFCLPSISIVTMLMILWLALYNFRDIVILQLFLVFIFSFLSHKRKLKVLLLITLAALFYFRYFYVAILIASYFGAWLISKRMGVKYLMAEFLLIIFLVQMSNINNYAALLVSFSDVLSGVSVFQPTSSNLLVDVVKGLVAGNPLTFLNDYAMGGGGRAFLITPLSALLMALVYLFSVVIVGYFFFSIGYVLVFMKGVHRTLIEGKLVLFLRTMLYFFIGVVIVYSTSMGGVQERIRIPLLVILTICLAILINKIPRLQYFYSRFAVVSTLMVIVLFFMTV